MEAIICETFEHFDVDGVELDFMRHPGYFRIEDARANAYLMTDLVRRVRVRLRRTGEERSRRLWAIVRVPPTLADWRRACVGLAGGSPYNSWRISRFLEASRYPKIKDLCVAQADAKLDLRVIRVRSSG